MGKLTERQIEDMLARNRRVMQQIGRLMHSASFVADGTGKVKPDYTAGPAGHARWGDLAASQQGELLERFVDWSGFRYEEIVGMIRNVKDGEYDRGGNERIKGTHPGAK